MRDDGWRNLLVLLALPALLVGVGLAATPRRRGGLEVLSLDQAWAAGRAPRAALNLASLAPLPSDAWPGFEGWFQVSVVARFASPGEAQAASVRVGELLRASAEHYAQPGNAEARGRLLDSQGPAPLTPPEAIRLGQAGITGLQAGIGWPGASQRALQTPLVWGDLVVVCGLKGDFRGLQPHPLAAYLVALGAQVWTEGDPGSPSFLVDLSCQARDAEHAARLARGLAAYLQTDFRPDRLCPWAPGVAPAHAGLRRGWVRARDAQLELGSLEWLRVGPGLWSLLTYLRAEGCDEVRVSLSERI